MQRWGVGFVIGFLFLNNALFTPQPLSALNVLVGVFFFVIIMVNYYGKR
jgi:hypothetical protein